MSAPSVSSVTDLLQRATWLAATLGSFNPAQLVGHVTQESGTRRRLVAQLAALCAEVSGAGTVLWSLNADARRRALNEMQQGGVFTQPQLSSFIESLPLAPGDQFGRYLRDALAGKADAESGAERDIEAQYTAYEFVGRADVGAAPGHVRESVSMVEQRAQRAAADQQLKDVIGPVFVGRTRELAALQEFALTMRVSAAEFAAKTPQLPSLAPLLFVNGIGGSGKSALIAMLVQRLRTAESGVAAAAVLDFDRPTLSSLDRVQLTLELIRQVALSQPHIAPALMDLRRTALAGFSDIELESGSDDVSFRRDSRALYDINLRLREILANGGVGGDKFLIILDTFEEVLTLGAPFVRAVYDWLEGLRSVAQLMNLRVIVSGRALPSDLDIAQPDPAAAPTQSIPANVIAEIPLGDLPAPEALNLLSLRGIETAIAERLLDRFGSNPLVLRLLGDYAGQKGPAAVRELMRDGRRREQYRAQVAQRILYSRILERIRNEPAVKALASPGLIVRVVTPGVIRHVLAGPCGLGTMDQQSADRLFGQLASQVWLVRRIGARAVSHRRDMRTVMLPFAAEPPRGLRKLQLTKQVARIHKNALRYYQTETDGDLTDAQRNNEEIYHQLFVEPTVAFARKDFSSALTNLAVDIADFPIAQQARLKRLLGRALTPAELRTLSARERKEYAKKLAALEIRSRGAHTVQSADADAPTAAVASRPFAAAKKSAPLTSGWDLALRTTVDAFGRAEFEAVAEHCAEWLPMFLERVASKSGYKLPADMTDDVTWMAALSTLIARPGGPTPVLTARWLNAFCDDVSRHWYVLTSRELKDRSELRLTHYLTAIAILLNRGRELDQGVVHLLQRLRADADGGPLRFEITSTASLRIFQLLVTADGGVELELSPKAVNLNCLQYFAGLLDAGYVRKLDSSMHSAQRAWSSRTTDLQPLAATFGTLFDKTPKAMSAATLAGIERKIGERRLDMYDWQPPMQQLIKGRRWKYVKRNYRPGALSWANLRGMAPDLQAPTLSALRDRFAVAHEAERVLGRLRKASRWWPRDLSIEALTAETVTNAGFLTTVSHHADRFAAMPLLFRQAQSGSIAWRLGRLYSTYAEMISAGGRLPGNSLRTKLTIKRGTP